MTFTLHRTHPRAFVFNLVIVGVFLVIVGRLAYEYTYVRRAYDREVEEQFEVNMEEYLASRALAHGSERYHEGRDYGRIVEYYYDQHGFRTEIQAERTLAPDEFSIALVGDSLTEGQFVPYDETLSYFLEGLFEDIPVYNLGVSGVDFRDEHQIVRYAHPLYDPEVLIWQWFLNDYYDYYNEGRALHEVFERKRLFFGRFLRPRMWNRVFRVSSYEEFEQIPDQTARTFDEIDASAYKNDLQIVFLMYPVPSETDLEAFDFGVYSGADHEGFEEYYRIFGEQATRRGYRCVEVEDVIPGYEYLSGEWSVIPQDPHPGEHSNRRMAEILHAYLTEEGLIPRPR